MRESAGDHHRRHDGQTVEAVGQVDRVAGADDDEIGQRDEADDAQRIGNALEEGHDQLGLRRRSRREGEKERGADADHRLPEILPARRQALRIAIDHLAPVVVPADGAEAQGDDQHHPDVAVGQVAPQQRRDADGDQDQRAAHGRRAGLDQMGLRPVVAHRLADLLLGQPADDARTGDEGDQSAPSWSPAPRAA